MHSHSSRTSAAPALDLPPPFRLVTLREVGDAFAHAKSIAAEAGAGTLVHVGRFDLAEFAVVLEPEEPLRAARGAFYAGLVALRDALLDHAPPDRGITFAWPDAVKVDGGLIGGARLAWPDRADENAPPDWLVFGAMVRTVAMGAQEAGLYPLSTALSDEGFGELGADRLVEGFARHLMVALDAWRTQEFAMVTGRFLQHLELEQGAIPAIDANGDLLVRRRGRAEPHRRALAQALAQASWLDPETGGPRR